MRSDEATERQAIINAPPVRGSRPFLGGCRCHLLSRILPPVVCFYVGQSLLHPLGKDTRSVVTCRRGASADAAATSEDQHEQQRLGHHLGEGEVEAMQHQASCASRVSLPNRSHRSSGRIARSAKKSGGGGGGSSGSSAVLIINLRSLIYPSVGPGT